MACEYKEITVAVPLQFAWDAISAFGEVHIKLAAGFITNTTLVDTVLTEKVRAVTFADGFVAKERLVSLNDEMHYLAYSAFNENIIHHHASMRLVAVDANTTQIQWLTDILPEHLIASISQRMNDAAIAIRTTLESRFETFKP